MSHKACVLVLEDDATQLATLEMRSKRLLGPGDVVFTASDGRKAIDIIQERLESPDRPCIFILDLNMPGEIKGFDVLRWIRGRSEYAGCAVVILTTSDSQMDRDRAIELGATRYYTKPRSLIEVGPLMKQILSDFRDVSPPHVLTDSMEVRLDRATGGGNG
jgi:DNA-binding response OmpR family regulator